MALFRGMGARKDATRGTAPIEVRKVLGGLLSSQTVSSGRPGVIAPGDRVILVEGTSRFAYAVWPAMYATSRGANDGVQIFGNDAYTETANVAPAPSSGLSRIDIIWVRHPTAGENGDTVSEPEVGVTSGVPASVPSPPSIPPGALELARNTLTSAATSTLSAGNSIQQTFQRTTLRGVAVPVRNQTERDALASGASAFAPARALRGDAGGREEVNVGSGWRVSVDPNAWTAYTPVWTGATNPSVGNGTIKGRWQQIGLTVNFAVELTIGDTGAAGGSGVWGITLPVAAASSGMRVNVAGQVRNGATRRLACGSVLSGGGVLTDMVDSAGANLIAGYLLAAGAILSFSGTYEAAA